METKRCSKCKIRKAPEFFSADHSRGDGLFPYCKPCVQKYQVRYTARQKPAPALDPRTCTACLTPKPLTDFYKDKSRSDGYSKHCKTCHCATRQAYVIANPEKVKANKLAWKRTPAGKVCEKRYYSNNRDDINTRARQRYADDPEKITERMRNWRIKNPEKAKAIMDRGNAKRAERLALAPINDFTKEQWLATLATFEYRCAYCGEGSNRLEQDHVIPLSKGGNHTASNIVPSCRSCNARKSAKILT